MSLIKKDLNIDQGEDFDEAFELWLDEAGTVADDLTGATAIAQIRTVATSPNVVKDFTCEIQAPQTVLISLDHASTVAVPVKDQVSPEIEPTVYCYDVFLTRASGKVTKISYGLVNIWPRDSR